MPEIIKEVEVTLHDKDDEGTQMFANLVDPLNLNVFIKRVNDASEKRGLSELVEALLTGK